MIFEQVKEEIVEILNCDESIVVLEADLREDLNADSLDATELIMNLEEKFDISISDEKIQQMETVGDIVQYIEENI